MATAVANSIDAMFAKLTKLVHKQRDEEGKFIRSSVVRAREKGEWLTKIRDACGHGDWTPKLAAWCDEIGVKKRQAMSYIEVFERWDEAEQLLENGETCSSAASLSQREFMRLLPPKRPRHTDTPPPPPTDPSGYTCAHCGSWLIGKNVPATRNSGVMQVVVT